MVEHAPELIAALQEATTAYMQKINVLLAQGRPVPTGPCHACGGTIYRVGAWYQCPDCGCRSTEFGGTFP